MCAQDAKDVSNNLEIIHKISSPNFLQLTRTKTPAVLNLHGPVSSDGSRSWFLHLFHLFQGIVRWFQQKKDKNNFKKDQFFFRPPSPKSCFLAKIAVNLKFWPFLALPQFIISIVIWKEDAFLNNLVPISFC